MNALFADGTAEMPIGNVIQILTSFGSAGLAAIAVWWLTGKHEKAFDKLSTGFTVGQELMAKTIEKIDLRQENRDKVYQDLADKKIQAVVQLANNIDTMTRGLDESNRRIEAVNSRLETIDRRLEVFGRTIDGVDRLVVELHREKFGDRSTDRRPPVSDRQTHG